MKLRDFLARLAATTKAYVQRELAPVRDRVAQLDAAIKAIPAGKDGAPGRDGKDVDPAALEQAVSTAITAAWQRAFEGTEFVTAKQLRDLVAEEIGKAVAALPAPKDGRDGVSVDEQAVKQMVDAAVGSAVAQIPAAKDGAPGKDGADGEVDEQLLRELVTAAVDRLPKPKDGKDADPEAMRAMVAESVRQAVEALPKPKDGERGRDGVDAVVDEAQLRAMVDAAVAELPKPKDGAPGRDGADAVVDETQLRAMVDAAVAALPKAKDGAPGRDGKDAAPGAPGKSAYELAVERGFRGTEAEWLDSLKGKDVDGRTLESLLPAGEMVEMVDEFTRSLVGHIEFGATPDEVLRQLVESVNGLDRTLKLPLVPVLDDDGNVIGATRAEA